MTPKGSLWGALGAPFGRPFGIKIGVFFLIRFGEPFWRVWGSIWGGFGEHFGTIFRAFFENVCTYFWDLRLPTRPIALKISSFFFRRLGPGILGKSWADAGQTV
jgi:hypothetical protein